MEEIANHIFIESRCCGVVLAVLKLKDGLIIVDAPFKPEDQQNWRAKLKEFRGANKRLLVMLDTHIDRTLGIRALETNVLGHANAVEIMRERPTTARGQDNDAGADWEPFDLPANIRWAIPDMTYSKRVTIHWDDQPVEITHHFGSHLAGSWLQVPAEKIIFIGDSIVLGQPPFLAWSDLDQWLLDLAWLGSDEFKGYQIISGRNGLVKKNAIEKMVKLLSQIKIVVDDLAGENNRIVEIIKVVPSLLKKFTYDKTCQEQYENRLIWGLDQYLKRHYPAADANHKG